MMLCLFRDRYPQGSLVSKLVKIDRGTYIVQVSITVDNVVLSTALAGAATVELAEDAARERAIATLFLDSQASTTSPQKTAVNPREIALSKESPAESNLASESAADNIVNFSQSDPKVAHQNNVSSLPTTPTVVPKSTAPKPIIEPTVVAQDSEPVTHAGNTGNLFAGTFPSEAQPPTFSEDNSAEETVSTISNENVPNEDFVATEPEITPKEIADFDFTTVKQKTDIEIKRLGWTRDDGREFLQSRYGKVSRLHLKDEELLEFLHYLEKQPTPVN